MSRNATNQLIDLAVKWEQVSRWLTLWELDELRRQSRENVLDYGAIYNSESAVGREMVTEQDILNQQAIYRDYRDNHLVLVGELVKLMNGLRRLAPQVVGILPDIEAFNIDAEVRALARQDGVSRDAALVELATRYSKSMRRIKHELREGVAVEKITETPKTHRAWAGSDDWRNWGVGIDEKGTWSLWHFRRDRMKEGWREHTKRGQVGIPAGYEHKIAEKFVYEGGILNETQVFNCCDRVRNSVAPSMSRLRKAIEKAVKSEGHTPKGMPISKKDGGVYRAFVKFGRVEQGSVGRKSFRPSR